MGKPPLRVSFQVICTRFLLHSVTTPRWLRPQPVDKRNGASMPNSVDPTKGRPIGVVVIDPVPLFRDGLGALLARTNGVRLLGMTVNLNPAIILAESTRPDVVLVDAMLDPRCHLGSLLQSSDDTLALLSVVR